MPGLIRAELVKLRTVRSSWVALMASVLTSPAIAVGVLATAAHLREAPSQIAGDAFGISSVTFGILSATWFAVEYQDRTIATTFMRVPARGRVVLAKAIVAMIVGVLAAAIATAACDLLAAAWLHGAGVAWPWTTGDLVQAALGNVALAAAMGVAGVAVGGLTQSPPLAGSVMGLVWLGLSNLLESFVPFLRHYGLIAAETALSSPTGHRSYSFGGALAVIVAITTLLLLAALRRVAITDIR